LIGYLYKYTPAIIYTTYFKMTDMSNIDIVYQQNHIEIYHVTGTIYDDSKILWYDRQRGLSEKDILQDPIYMDDLENRMPPKEFRRFDFYRTWIYDMVDIFRSYSQFFIVTYCPSDINTFDQESPRSIVSICRKDGNTIIIDSLQVTVAGLLWELHGGNEQNMIPRYRRTRETSTEPMFEAFFIYMIKMYSELKYGSVSPSDGTYSLLNIWFDIYSNDSDELIDIQKEHGQIDSVLQNASFFLRTPYFEKIIHGKKQKIDIQCQICDQQAMFQCGNYCGKLYCNDVCANNDWIKHTAICFASLNIKK
jgi:hypothetical protein